MSSARSWHNLFMQSPKQRGEDVTGTDHTDSGLLALGEPARAHRDALMALAQLLRQAVLVGDPAPIVERIRDRMRTPLPGDLVVETSLPWTIEDERRETRLGILLERRVEWMHTDEEWDALAAEAGYDEGDARPTEMATYVQFGPSSTHVFRWHNAEFMTLPIHDIFCTPGLASDDGGEITRQSLMSSLADSGFHLRNAH